jgi:hypothetical protein
MKSIAWLFLLVLCAATLVQAQSSGKRTSMTGTPCRSSCVTQVDNAPTCDKECTDKSGDMVFVGDNGRVMKIENQDMVKEEHMGKHMMIMATPSEADRERTLRIESLSLQAGG